jgi:drug/metabolite transporter (DMT)-like permease
MKSERLRIAVGFLLIFLIWGSTWLVIKIGVATVPPFLAAGVRFALAVCILAVIVRIRKIPVPRTPDALRVYAAVGLCTFGLSFALVYWAEQFIPSALASILFAASPFWVALFSRLLLSTESIDKFKAAGILSGFAGIVVIFWGDIGPAGSSAAPGMLAIVAGTILQAFAVVFTKRHGQAVNPFVLNMIGMAIGTACLLSLSLATEQWTGIHWNQSAVLSILYLAVFGSVIAFVTFYWLLKHTEPVYLSFTTFVNPIVAILLGAVVLGESLGAPVLIGACLVLAGILIANGRHFLSKMS